MVVQMEELVNIVNSGRIAPLDPECEAHMGSSGGCRRSPGCLMKTLGCSPLAGWNTPALYCYGLLYTECSCGM